MRTWYRHLDFSGLLALRLAQASPFLLTDGDMVVIVKADQIAKLQMASQRRCLARKALHSATIAKNAVCVVRNEVEARLVELGSGV